MADGASKRGPRVIAVNMPRATQVKVYANARVADALKELTEDMSLYHGVRLAQVFDAVYEQGRRDGRADVFEHTRHLEQLPELKHRNPGRPRKVTKAKATKRKSSKRKATKRKTTKRGATAAKATKAKATKRKSSSKRRVLKRRRRI